uniref:Neuroglobin-2 n=1 Tax=Rattus norvegicus TaxID=10116 RepID=Q99N61_RAT|nr:neuroglobin-2 [Rattus norvegicus]
MLAVTNVEDLSSLEGVPGHLGQEASGSGSEAQLLLDSR